MAVCASNSQISNRAKFAHRMIVLNFIKIVWTHFDKFEISLKGREKKSTIA